MKFNLGEWCSIVWRDHRDICIIPTIQFVSRDCEFAKHVAFVTVNENSPLYSLIIVSPCFCEIWSVPNFVLQWFFLPLSLILSVFCILEIVLLQLLYLEGCELWWFLCTIRLSVWTFGFDAEPDLCVLFMSKFLDRKPLTKKLLYRFCCFSLLRSHQVSSVNPLSLTSWS